VPADEIRWPGCSSGRSQRNTPASSSQGAVGTALAEEEIVHLFEARGPEFAAVCAAADALRAEVCGDEVTYAVNRNINYTNVCYFRCQFCAFSKRKLSENLRGRPYDLPLAGIERRVREAWERGATEVCMQGGIHPALYGCQLPGGLPRSQEGGTGDTCACLFATRASGAG
jgi:FO synthase